MANYSKEKNVDINEEQLKIVRNEAISKAKNCDEILIIGVKPVASEDDEFVSKMFEMKYDRITYVSNDANDCNKIKCKYPHATIYQNGFGDFIFE